MMGEDLSKDAAMSQNTPKEQLMLKVDKELLFLKNSNNLWNSILVLVED